MASSFIIKMILLIQNQDYSFLLLLISYYCPVIACIKINYFIMPKGQWKLTLADVAVGTLSCNNLISIYNLKLGSIFLLDILWISLKPECKSIQTNIIMHGNILSILSNMKDFLLYIEVYTLLIVIVLGISSPILGSIFTGSIFFSSYELAKRNFHVKNYHLYYYSNLINNKEKNLKYIFHYGKSFYQDPLP